MYRNRIVIAVAAAAIAGGTTFVAVTRDNPSARAGAQPSTSRGADAQGRATSEQAGKTLNVPSVITNAHGTVRTTKFDAIARRSTGDHPYGPFAGDGTLAGYGTRADLLANAKAVVLVEVLEISNPHYNSDDGGFWVPLPGQSQGTVQDVRVRVVEKWGDKLGLPAEFTIADPGGQVEVTLNAAQAAAMEIDKPGTYIFGSHPNADLAVGERRVLVLDKGGIGWQGGEKQALYVLGGDQGNFDLESGQVTNELHPEWATSADTLRSEVTRLLGTPQG